jgi:hypothetical protein
MAHWKEGTEQVVEQAVDMLDHYFDFLRRHYPEMDDLEAMHKRWQAEQLRKELGEG